MTQIEKAGNFALFFNFCLTILVVIFSWSDNPNSRIEFNIPVEVPYYDATAFSFDSTTIIITIIVILLVIPGLLGVQILGSGLQDSSVKFMTAVLTKALVYMLLSLFSYSVLILLGAFGQIIFWLITFLFSLGLAESMFNKE